MARAAIIGGGLSGLVSAWALQREGFAVTVFEAADQVGGAVKSFREEGFLLEYGPNTLQLNSREVAAMIEEIGLGARVLEAFPTASKRFIVRRGKPVALPQSPLGFLTTPWLSPRGKLRLLAEPFIRARRQPPGPFDLPLPPGLSLNLPDESVPEETLAQMVTRRLGREMLDYAVNPFVGGIYAGRPEELSVRHGFPRLFRLEQAYGSFIRGTFTLMTGRHRDPDRQKARLISFAEGLGVLPEALRRAIGVENVRLRQPVRGIVPEGAAWQLEGVPDDASGPYERVVLATPAFGLRHLSFPDGVADPAQRIAKVPHAPVVSMALGFRRNQVRHPLDGFGFLVPEVEDVPILGTLFSSSLFPGRAPDGQVLLTTFVGGQRDPQAAAMSETTLVARVLRALRNNLGITGEPVFVRTTYWPKAIPQVMPGYEAVLEACAEIEVKLPGVFLTGNYRGGIALGQVIRSALATARRAAGHPATDG